MNNEINEINEINSKLAEAQQGILRLEKINSMLEDLDNQKESFAKKISELKEILKKEDFDVDKLEGKSMSHILHLFLGNLDEHLEKEQKEAIAARIKYDQAVRDLENIYDQISKLNSEMIQYESCESDYRELYEKKKDMLLQSDSLMADKILSWSEKSDFINNHLKEIDEAITAGNMVITHLDKAIESLNSAEGWGTWDMLGGGLISDLAKHSHIDTATSEVEESQKALLSFRTELADVRILNNIDIEIDEFSKFADFFFDGIFADWNMQSKILRSQENVRDTRNQVKEVISKLESMEKEGNLELEQLKEKMDGLILKA